MIRRLRHRKKMRADAATMRTPPTTPAITIPANSPPLNDEAAELDEPDEPDELDEDGVEEPPPPVVEPKAIDGMATMFCWAPSFQTHADTLKTLCP